MASSAYLDAVGQYLRADGWEIGSTQLQQGTFLIRGRQQSGGAEQSILTMVITDEAGQATPDHLKHLLQTSREEAADLSILAAEPPIGDELQAAAADNEVHVLADEELDSQPSTESTSDPEPTDTQSASEQEPTVAAATDHDSVPDPWTSFKTYLDSKLSRRQLLASSVLLVGGTAAGGYGWYRFAPSPLERLKADAEEVAYEDLLSNVEAYLDTPVYYGPARVAQRIDTESGSHLRLQVTQDDQGGWRDDLLGRWDGEAYAPGDTVEFWGVVTGSVSYETTLGIERTVPEVEIVDIATVEP